MKRPPEASNVNGQTFYFCCETLPSEVSMPVGKQATCSTKPTITSPHQRNSRFRVKYFCPMCEGVESDKPGTCPKCGMALEPARPAAHKQKVIYTCPMHPEIEQDGPGTCPKCGMALEPKTVEPDDGGGRF